MRLSYPKYHSGPGTYINSRPTLAHIETMVSFGCKKISMTNKKIFLALEFKKNIWKGWDLNPQLFWTIVSH